MEPGFVTASCSNLSRIDLLILGDFLASNIEFCSEFTDAETLFPRAVTCISISINSPNMVAVGFFDGLVNVIDISSKVLKVLYQIMGIGPLIVSSIFWVPFNDMEVIFFTAGNSVYKITGPFINAELKRMNQTKYLPQKEGVSLRKTPTLSYFLTVGPAIRAFYCPRSNPEFYIVGDTDGDLRVCSVHTKNEFLGIFTGHIGTVNVIKPSPFDDEMFITCGSDGRAQIWLLHIGEPLLTLESGLLAEDIRDISWNPNYATIIAGVTAFNLCIWDFHRKFNAPVSVVPLPNSPKCIEFSATGLALVVGTNNGGICIGLEGMPFPEYYKAESVIQAIKRWLRSYEKLELLYEFRSKMKKRKNSNL